MRVRVRVRVRVFRQSVSFIFYLIYICVVSVFLSLTVSTLTFDTSTEGSIMRSMTYDDRVAIYERSETPVAIYITSVATSTSLMYGSMFGGATSS